MMEGKGVTRGPARGSRCQLPRVDLRLRRRLSACPIATPSLGSTREHVSCRSEHEVFMGFIFVRFEAGLPSVREMAAPYTDSSPLTGGRARASRPRERSARGT